MQSYPLTKPQKQIYDMESFGGGSISNISLSFFLHELDDLSIHEKAINKIVEYNDILRARIRPDLTQEIVEYTYFQLEVKKFADEDEFRIWAEEYSRIKFDIYDRMFEFYYLDINGLKHGIFVKFHHLINDAWSTAFLFQSYFKTVDAIRSGKNPETTFFSYTDYIEAENKYISSERFVSDKKYWANQFYDFSEPVFFSDKTNVSLQTERLNFVMSAERVKLYRQFANDKQITFFALLLSAFSVYYSRIKGVNKFNLGTTVLNRESRKEKNTAGMFVNTVPICVALEENENLEENTRFISESLLPIFKHQRFNYNDILSDVCERFKYTGKLFDVLINYQNVSLKDIVDNSVVESIIWYNAGMQLESIQVQISDLLKEDQLLIQYDYQIDKFSKTDIENLHNRILTILDDGIKNDSKAVCALEIIPQSEKDKLLTDLNNTEHELNKVRCIHKYFEENVRKYPEKTALIFEERRLTYKELDLMAEKVAGIIRKHKIKPDSTVALLMDRCLEMLPVMIGAMKAGCAYMPLSPAYPADRIDYMLENSKAAICFCQDKFTHSFNVSVFSVDVAEIENFEIIEQPADSENNPESLAYILYTSGSTGRPKGVQIEHRSVVNRLLWMNEKYPLANDEILIQKTNYAFDVSVWELFWALMTGRTLLVPAPGAEKDPKQLIYYINKENIHKIHFVPSMLTVFLDYLEASGEKLSSLRNCIVSGEALTPALNKKFYSLFEYENTQLNNLYGPTECTVDVLYYDCKPSDTEIPIGLPVWNTSAYIVDSKNRLLPQGVEGELAIGGIQLARGYVDESLNENRFIETENLGRIYRTGDKAVLRADGQILYLGRNDDQIKIRGQRVELSDIEASIMQIDGISQAAVIFTGDTLIAFFKSAKEFARSEIAAFLVTRLPGYMIPSKFIQVDLFPLNSNGKLAKSKLLEQYKTEISAMSSFENVMEEPATEHERLIYASVIKRLNKDRISVSESLLDSGLTSIDIIAIIAELETFGVELKVNDFYTWDNIRAVANNSIIGKRPLLHIFNSCECDSALLCIPYGGGSFGSFAPIANTLGKKTKLPIIAVQNAHVDAQQVTDALKQYNFKSYIVLGCCVGSALTINISQFLELERGISVKSVFLLSSIPPSGVSLYGSFFNPWKFSSQGIINTYLRGLSDKDFKLGANEIEQFRDDVGYFLKFLAANKHPKLMADINLIYGAQDPMIGKKDAAKAWSKYLGKKVKCKLIDNAKHYIVHTHTDEIADEIIKYL